MKCVACARRYRWVTALAASFAASVVARSLRRGRRYRRLIRMREREELLS